MRALAVVAAALPLAANPAHADVMEVSANGFGWVAGGPVRPAASAPAERLSATTTATFTTAAAAFSAPGQWQGHLAALSARYDLSPALIEALVWQESRWNAAAVSPKGARGLAQLMPATARQLGVDPLDPAANLDGGARYLRQQIDAFGGDLEKALAAYNAGPGRVQRAGGVPRIPETQAYVAAIMGRLAETSRR